MDELQEAPLQPNAQRRFLTFRLQHQLYAFPAEYVAEVIRVPVAARVPQSPAPLLGIANVRGSILPLVSLRGLLSVAEAATSPASRAIVLANGPALAVAVDSVEALVSIDADRIETRQVKLGASAKERLSGAFQTASGAAKVLDIRLLLDTAFAERVRPQAPARTRQVSAAKDGQEQVVDVEMIVTFDVGGGEFALRLDAVEEIVSVPDRLARPPDAEALVLGMMTFRGLLLPLLSLHGLLGVASSEGTTERQKVLIARVGGVLVGLVADRARAIVAARRDLIDPVPTVLAARIAGEAKLTAIYRGEGGRRLISILSPERLFREDVMRRLESERHAAPPRDAAIERDPHEELKFLVFRLGDDEFGLPVDAVDEIAKVPGTLTRVPKTPKFLEGVVNLRGTVLPVVDQRRRFDMPKLEDDGNRRLIVVRTARHRAGLIVDSVSEVLRCSAESIEATPNLTEDTSRLVRGVINLKDQGRIVLLLEPAELLTRAEHSLLDAFKPVSESAPS